MRNTNIRLTARLIVSAMMLMSIARSEAKTEQTRQVSIVQEMSSVGFGHGQIVRYTWTNLNDSNPKKRLFEAERLAVRMFSSDGIVLAEIGVPAPGIGQMKSSDFDGDPLISSTGATDRLQVRLEVTVIGTTKWPNLILKQGIQDTFDQAVEVVEAATGGTVIHTSGGFNQIELNDTPGKEKLSPTPSQTLSAGNDFIMGTVPGELVRVTALNPFEQDSGQKFKMLFAFTVLNANGEVIATSDEVILDPAEFRFVDFDLHGTRIGETGRIQARIEVRYRFFNGLPARISQGQKVVFVEIVEFSSGRTVQNVTPGSVILEF